MKKTAYLLLSVLCFGLVSCEDYLDTDSASYLSPDIVYNSIAYTDQAILGIYAQLPQDQIYGSRLQFTYGSGSDCDTYGTSNPTDTKNSGLANYNGTSDNTAISKEWDAIYKTIEMASVAIDGIRNSELLKSGTVDEQAQMREYLGEALTLRAQLYFEVVRNFGDVPFKDEPTNSDGSNIYLPATDRDEIYEHIIADAEEAAGYLPWLESSANVERVSKGFAYGLAARMSLACAGYSMRNLPGFPLKTPDFSVQKSYYERALKNCNAIIKDPNNPHGLEDTFAKVFDNQTQQKYGEKSEDLFEVGLGLGLSGEVGYTSGVRFYQSAIYGRNNSVQVVTNAYYLYSFDRDDMRRDVTIAPYNYNKSGTEKEEMFSNLYEFTFAKWDVRNLKAYITQNKEATNKLMTGINWCIMRYSDVLLMAAEANVWLAENGGDGNLGEARAYVKEVRRRNFSDALQATKVDAYVDNASDLMQVIKDERMFEFGGEAIRKFDLIRWGELSQKVAEYRTTLKQMYAGEYEITLPELVYFKYNSDGSTIDKSSVDYFGENGVPEGVEGKDWDSVNWFKKKDTDIAKASDKIDAILGGLDKVYYCRHLFPIHESTISSSQGKLSNSYGF